MFLYGSEKPPTFSFTDIEIMRLFYDTDIEIMR